jgi:signal transduction histidine kinase
MVLVFNFAARRHLRLIEKNQKAELRIARAREEGLNALIIGVENERKRIARDLHDGACVNLAAINMKVDALREDVSANPALVSKIADIADDLDQTYREVRGISHDLMSKSLDSTGLQTALEELAVRMQQAQKGLSVNFYANYPLDRVNDLAKIHLYRIAQELLANVLKHAHSSNVNVQLLEDEGNLLLTVEDDGRGFNVEKALSNGGIGLSNIRARVEVLHGKLHLDSAAEKGTFVSIEIPRSSMT